MSMLTNNFDKRAKHYKKYARIQKIAAENLVNILKDSGEKDLKRTLELGAGSGIFTDLIKSNFDYENIFCVDLACNFLKLNRESEKVQCNILKLPFKKQSFSTVLSSSVVQWINNFDELLKEINYVGKNNFRAAFSIFLKGTFYEMDKVSKMTGFGNVLKMKESSYYLENFYKNGFVVDFFYEEKYTHFFDSVRDFLNNHKHTGATIKAKRTVNKSDYNSFIKYYESLFSLKNKIPASYNVGYFVVSKAS